MIDGRLHDQLVAGLKFQLSAIEVRAPAILPGGSRSNGLASIAEASGVTGSNLAGAVIRFFGMLWPNQRRFKVRVRVESVPGDPPGAENTKVTVSLDEPATGQSVASKTMVAGDLDEAAAAVAGYVAQHIFIRDPCPGQLASGQDQGAGPARHAGTARHGGTPDRKWPPAEKRDRTRWLPWQRRTPSWEAAYNTACAYAALDLDDRVIISLQRAINNRDCELQRPWDWISQDPDFCYVKSSKKFNDFLDAQERNDYPAAIQCSVDAGGKERAIGCDMSSAPAEAVPAGSTLE